MKPSGYCSRPITQSSVSLCEPEIYGHSRSYTHQHTIYFINYEINTQNSPNTVTDCPNGFQKFQQFGPKFWDGSNSRSRHQTSSIIHTTLKQSVTSSRIKTLLHGVCGNSKKPVHTCRSRCVEKLSFLLQRNPTIRLAGILKRSCSLSKKNQIS